MVNAQTQGWCLTQEGREAAASRASLGPTDLTRRTEKAEFTKPGASPSRAQTSKHAHGSPATATPTCLCAIILHAVTTCHLAATLRVPI